MHALASRAPAMRVHSRNVPLVPRSDWEMMWSAQDPMRSDFGASDSPFQRLRAWGGQNHG